MNIETVRNKSLRAFLETGKPKGIDAKTANRIRNIIALLLAAKDVDELKIPPNFGFHWLVGDRAGTGAMVLTKNWRLTFKVSDSSSIIDLDWRIITDDNHDFTVLFRSSWRMASRGNGRSE